MGRMGAEGGREDDRTHKGDKEERKKEKRERTMFGQLFQRISRLARHSHSDELDESWVDSAEGPDATAAVFGSSGKHTEQQV